jgi:hypothetical protein
MCVCVFFVSVSSESNGGITTRFILSIKGERGRVFNTLLDISCVMSLLVSKKRVKIEIDNLEISNKIQIKRQWKIVQSMCCLVNCQNVGNVLNYLCHIQCAALIVL